MQTAAQAMPLTLKPESSTTERRPVPETWVERVFERFTMQIGVQKVAEMWAGVDQAKLKAEWADALAGFEPAEIGRGLEACRARAFAPTLGEFLRLCRPALDPEVAWLEAQACMRQRDDGEAGDWTHPGVYRAAAEMAYEVRGGTYREHRKRWDWLLQREMRKGWLLGIPKPVQRLSHSDAPTRGPTEEERKRLAELRATSSPSFTNEGAQP